MISLDLLLKVENLSSFLKPFENFILSKIFVQNNFWARFIPVLWVLFFTLGILFLFDVGYFLVLFKGFYQLAFFGKPQDGYFWQAIIDQGGKLFDSTHNQFLIDHMSSRKFRIVIPVIAHFLHLNPLQLFAIQLVSGILFANLLLGYLCKLFDDRFLAFLAFICFENVYIGANYFINFYGHLDGFTYLFLLCALLFAKRPLVFSIFLQLSFWSDERSLFAVIPIFLITYFETSSNQKLIKKQVVTFVFNYLFYFVLYVLIGYKYKIGPFFSDQAASMTQFLQNFYGLSLWMGNKLFDALESMWIIVFLGTYFVLKSSDKWFIKWLFLGYIGVVFSINFFVADTIRSTSFALIMICYCLYQLKQNLSPNFLKELLYFVAIMSVLKPIVFP